MPRKSTRKGSRKSRKTRRGRGKVTDWLRKANDWLRKTKVVSKVANSLGSVGVPYAGAVGNVADKLGYGRRRSRKHYGRRSRKHMRGRGVGIAGTTSYSAGRVQF